MTIYRYGPTREDFIPESEGPYYAESTEITDWLQSLPITQSDEEWPPPYVKKSYCPPAYSNGLKRKTKIRNS